MNSTLKITKIGNSAGVILPRDVLAHLNVQVGETLSLVTTLLGIELSATAPDFEAQMAAARQVMLRRKRALRELAKSHYRACGHRPDARHRTKPTQFGADLYRFAKPE